MGMIRTALLPAAAALALSLPAHAQFGVYGAVTLNDLSGIKSSPNAVTTFSQNGVPTSVSYLNNLDPLGGTGGVFYDFKTYGRVRLGADVRGVITDGKRGAEVQAQGSGVRIASALGGLRVVFHTRYAFLKPYVEPAFGLGRSDFGLLVNPVGKPAPVNALEYHVFAGVDLKALPVLDWRVVEIGYGGLDSFGTGAHNYPIKSVSTGIVLHFPSY